MQNSEIKISWLIYCYTQKKVHISRMVTLVRSRGRKDLSSGPGIGVAQLILQLRNACP
jgi:hypothetical protein